MDEEQETRCIKSLEDPGFSPNSDIWSLFQEKYFTTFSLIFKAWEGKEESSQLLKSLILNWIS